MSGTGERSPRYQAALANCACCRHQGCARSSGSVSRCLGSAVSARCGGPSRSETWVIPVLAAESAQVPVPYDRRQPFCPTLALTGRARQEHEEHDPQRPHVRWAKTPKEPWRYHNSGDMYINFPQRPGQREAPRGARRGSSPAWWPSKKSVAVGIALTAIPKSMMIARPRRRPSVLEGNVMMHQAHGV